MIERWLSTQNTGDFAGYAALYANTFRGTKRVGFRLSRYNRARWLAYRRTMFAKPMHVEARDVQVSLQGLAIARKRVRPDAVPERLAKLQGQTVALYGFGGRQCTAKLGDFFGLRRGIARYDVSYCWHDAADCDPESYGPPMTDEQITQTKWDEGVMTLGEDDPRYMLVAELIPQEGSCTGARWARSLDRPLKEDFRQVPVSPDMERRAWEAVRKLRQYRDTVRDHAWRARDGESKRWEDGVDRFMIREWVAEQRTLVTFEARCPDGRARWLTAVVPLRQSQPRLLSASGAAWLVVRGNCDSARRQGGAVRCVASALR